MYLNYKDRKIQTQKKFISRLQEENNYLKEQLKQHTPEHTKAQMELMEQAYNEYQALTKELYNLKSEYQELIRLGKTNQYKFLHASRISK